MNSDNRFPTIELALGMHFNECSIAAADANKRAYELLTDRERTVRRQLFLVDTPDERPISYDFMTAPLVDDITLDDGRPVELALIQRTSDGDTSGPLLAAIARGNIAFPVVGFRRREGSFCDYVQLGQEIDAEDIVVTSDDETSRKVLVEDMRVVIDADPLVMIYKEALKHDRNEYSERTKLIDAIKSRRDFYAVIRPELPKEMVYECTILNAFSYGPYDEKNPIDLNNYCSYMAYNQTRAQLHEEKAVKMLANINQVDLKDIRDGKIPGSRNPLTKKLLLRHALYTRGINGDMLQRTAGAAKRLLCGLDAARTIRESLGPYDASLEKTIKFAGDLAIRDMQLKTVVEDFRYASTVADTEIIVSAKPNGKVGAFILHVAARPMGMERSRAVESGVYIIDRFGLNTLDPNEIQELSSLVDLMSP